MEEQTIGFIGAGNMASSLAGGMIARGMAPERIRMSDRDQGQREAVSRRHGIATLDDNAALARECDALVLAVKPQQIEEVCTALRPVLAERAPLVISIAAGVPVARLREWLGDGVPVIRTMPNTPSLVQVGATGLFAGPGVTPVQQALAHEVLESVGQCFWFEQEEDLDRVTAVSGSGPAYFFLLMEAMIEAGRQQGLDEQTARKLVLQTARGAAELAATGDDDPATLRARVTSPGGTTAAALEVFQQGGFSDLVSRAVDAARRRAEELGN